jgi:hypothetical protein
MRKLLLVLMVLTVSGMFAQGEFLNKSNSLSGTGISTPNPSGGIAKPSVFNPKPATTAPSKPKPIAEKPIQMMQDNNFSDAGTPVMTKMNTKKETEFNEIYVDKDMNFGVFKTKSDYVRICYRDFSDPDGDMVRIYTQDMMLVPVAILSNDCQYMKLNLLKGENIINFEALNEGTGSPNTGELQIFDDQGTLIVDRLWGLETGYKGIVTIYKER